MLNGFLLLQSMAGGTGAGVGTYIATALRDEYPVTHALNCCVWPYESGEVIVQVWWWGHFALCVETLVAKDGRGH